MKTLLILLTLASCSTIPMKSPEKGLCSWDKPFTPCKAQVKPIWKDTTNFGYGAYNAPVVIIKGQ